MSPESSQPRDTSACVVLSLGSVLGQKSFQQRSVWKEAGSASSYSDFFKFICVILRKRIIESSF